MKQYCKNCKYYSNIGRGQGQCRVLPPRIIPNGDMASINNTSFPIVADVMWCGECVESESSKLENAKKADAEIGKKSGGKSRKKSDEKSQNNESEKSSVKNPPAAPTSKPTDKAPAPPAPRK